MPEGRAQAEHSAGHVDEQPNDKTCVAYRLAKSPFWREQVLETRCTGNMAGTEDVLEISCWYGTPHFQNVEDHATVTAERS